MSKMLKVFTLLGLICLEVYAFWQYDNLLWAVRPTLTISECKTLEQCMVWSTISPIGLTILMLYTLLKREVDVTAL